MTLCAVFSKGKKALNWKFPRRPPQNGLQLLICLQKPRDIYGSTKFWKDLWNCKTAQFAAQSNSTIAEYGTKINRKRIKKFGQCTEGLVHTIHI